MPQLIRFERYRLVAYSRQILAHPPITRWQVAAYSLAEPSPGLLAYRTLPTQVLSVCKDSPRLFRYSAAVLSSSSVSNGLSPAISADSHFCISLQRPTYCGSRADRAYSASFKGLSGRKSFPSRNQFISRRHRIGKHGGNLEQQILLQSRYYRDILDIRPFTSSTLLSGLPKQFSTLFSYSFGLK